MENETKKIVPFCAWCKRKMRDETGEWKEVDSDIENGDVEITHSICPDCAEKALSDAGL